MPGPSHLVSDEPPKNSAISRTDPLGGMPNTTLYDDRNSDLGSTSSPLHSSQSNDRRAPLQNLSLAGRSASLRTDPLEVMPNVTLYEDRISDSGSASPPLHSSQSSNRRTPLQSLSRAGRSASQRTDPLGGMPNVTLYEEDRISDLGSISSPLHSSQSSNRRTPLQSLSRAGRSASQRTDPLGGMPNVTLYEEDRISDLGSISSPLHSSQSSNRRTPLQSLSRAGESASPRTDPLGGMPNVTLYEDRVSDLGSTSPPLHSSQNGNRRTPLQSLSQAERSASPRTDSPGGMPNVTLYEDRISDFGSTSPPLHSGRSNDRRTPLLNLSLAGRKSTICRRGSQDGLSQVSLSLASFRKDSIDPVRDSQPQIIGLDLEDATDSIPGPPSAKDQGYAWIVVLMVFLLNTITAGYVKSFGITYSLILDYFPEATGSQSGWIMGLLVGFRGLLAPAMGALTVIIGPRKCVVTGGLLCVAGFLLAVPAFNIPYLAATLGGVVGIGMCMAETPGFLLVTDYFDLKRSLANGFRAAGNPTGGFIFSPLIVFLQQYYGLRGAFFIIAGVMLHLVIVGMLLRPYSLHERLVQAMYWKEKQKDCNVSDLQIRKMQQRSMALQDAGKKKPLDFTFFKNPAYLVYLLTMMCSAAALPNAIFYASLYGRAIGLTDIQNSAFASYVSFCDIIIRLLCGFIFNMEKANKRYGFIIGLLLGGIGCLSVPLCTNMWHLLFFGTMYSLCMAFYWTLVNVLLADQFGGDAMASTWGFFRMFQGICNFMYPSLLGLAMDVSGGVSVPYILMGSLLILAALIFAAQPLVAKLPGSKVIL
ncbi:monocarboxylate transporter 2-like [Macrobrachium nipponense]|uniref:monocarboxylate transporter 2-like n=1 Tax=Macrobrachium nipponense TaxID=159736 RepID=UPI0030C8BF2D